MMATRAVRLRETRSRTASRGSSPPATCAVILNLFWLRLLLSDDTVHLRHSSALDERNWRTDLKGGARSIAGLFKLVTRVGGSESASYGTRTYGCGVEWRATVAQETRVLEERELTGPGQASTTTRRSISLKQSSAQVPHQLQTLLPDMCEITCFLLRWPPTHLLVLTPTSISLPPRSPLVQNSPLYPLHLHRAFAYDTGDSSW